MYTNRIFRMACALMLLCAFSCASVDPEESKRQGAAIRAIGEAYMAQHKYSLALKELIKAEKIYSDDHILQNDLGIAYMGKERIDLAIPCFKRAIELKPDFAVAKNNLGTAYIAHEEWDLAIEVLESIFEDLFYATPHYPHANMGWAYFNKRDFPEAEKHYLQALEIEPNFSVALRGLGRTYMRQGKNEEAVKTLGKAVKLSPGPAKGEAWLLLAKAYIANGENYKAREALHQVMTIAPDSRLAAEAEQTLKVLP